MRRLLTILFLILPGLAIAQPFPALYDVAGVAADDVLNIRMEPDAGAAIIGSLAPGAEDVEVVRLADGKAWGLVNTGDLAGWVSMRYMARQPGRDWGTLPLRFSCFGTEPFWDFRVQENGEAVFSTPEGSRGFQVTSRLPGVGYPGVFAVIAGAPDGRATTLVTSQLCNDGMSNREYGFAAGVVLETDAAGLLYSGCCSLAP